MSSTRSSAMAQAEPEVLVVLAAGIGGRRQSHPVAREVALERVSDRRGMVREVRTRRLDRAEVGMRVAVEQVGDHLDRVLALLLGLLVEERAELRERLRRVVRADPNVLMGRRELTGVS
jgi:hypothetical protein